ncbi:hypothetical protein SLS57_003805 [Botryosphaeria dothidea]
MDKAMPEKEKSHSTAYLDGLRGIAALIVFSFHTLWAYCGFVEYGYGDGPKNRYFLQLPAIRLVHAGHAMVPVFFVVGGYVMALKPLKRVRAHDCEDLHLSLVGSVLRKAMRLYLPAVIATFVTMLSLHFGLWEFSRRFVTIPRLFNYPDKHPLPERTLAAEIARWIHATVGLTNIFTYYNKGFVLPYYNPYDPHLWYLPFELRSTVVVGTILLALFRCRTIIRMVLTLAAIILSCLCDRWECMLFLSGAFLADIDMEYRDRSIPTRLPSRLRSLLPYVLLVPALYLLSSPNLRIMHTPGYASLRIYFVPASMTDPKRFLHGAGAVLLLAALMRSPALQHLFVTSFAREAGRRSYALYVVHGPLVHIVNYSVTPVVWQVVGYRAVSDRKGQKYGNEVDGEGLLLGQESRWAVGFLVGAIITWGVVWVAAGLFEKSVERRCARLARVVERSVFARQEAQEDVHEEVEMGRLLPQ